MRRKLLFFLSCMLVATEMLAENSKTISVTFSDFTAGSQYAENERHDLGDGLVIYTTECHFTEQLRIYSSDAHNGYVVSDPLSGTITGMSFEMGYGEDKLNVYGSTDKKTWTLIQGIETFVTSYKKYSLEFPEEKGYTCFKFDVKGENQIRIQSMSVTYISNGDSDEGTNEEETTVVSPPTFIPGSSTFTTESLDVAISATEGCEVYYTIDGSTPSYTDAETFVGTKGNAVTIAAADSKVTLQAIAVDPTTGKCSEVSSSTYTYTPIINDGSEEKPYTVAEVAAMKVDQGTKEFWVKGTIYGTMLVSGKIEEVTTSVTEFLASNMVIGDELVRIPIQLPEGDIQDKINLKSHPYLQGKEILIKGRLESYCGSMGVKSPSKYQITYDVPINSYGYATLFLDMPVTVPTGCTAYYCTVEGDLVKLLPVEGIIPAGVGVVVKYSPNTTCKFHYTTEENSDEETIREDNQLIGYTKDMVVEDSDKAYYALNAKEGKVGFYIPKTIDANGSFTAKANKAYLQVPAESQVTMYLLQRGADETAIVPVTHVSDDAIYDLQGRIVVSPAAGIYIKAGKKVIIK